MILLLSTRTSPSVAAKLADLDEVRTVKVPAPPRRPAKAAPDAKLRRQVSSTAQQKLWQPNADWAYRDLEKVRRLLRKGNVTAVVANETGAQPFAWRVGEIAPDVPVLIGQDVAAKVLGLLRSRGAAPGPAGCTTASVRELLDPMRPPTARVPAYLTDRGARPPLVVSIVENSIIGDSRVQKVAQSLAELGYQSILLGVSPRSTEKEFDYFVFGRSIALRLPVERRLLSAQENRPPRSLPAKVLGFASAQEEAAAWELQRQALHATPKGTSPPLAKRVSRKITALRSWMYQRNRASFMNRDERRLPHRWRASLRGSPLSRARPEDSYPMLLDLEMGMGPVLDELKPDAIHVHDPLMLGIAMAAKGRLQTLGIDVRIVFDAHEWTPGIARSHAYRVAALTQLEREYVPQADAVVTVSDVIADQMQERFALPHRPSVVTNAPALGIDENAPDIRTDCGLAPGVPLLVYVGVVAVQRGVDDAVAALQNLPDAHLAVVAPANRASNQMLRAARALGVADRVHRLDYVPVEQVTSYLRSADIGLIPFRPLLNSEMGLATKFREYLLAGLPIVATDMGLTAAEIRRTGIGELCPPESPKDMARAATKVLADPEPYHAAITPELRTEHCWETQVATLAGLYATTVPRDPVPPPPADGRLVIGALNSAGQAYEWARALRTAGVDARALELRVAGNPFTHEADILIPRESVETLQRRLLLMQADVLTADTIIMESGRPIAAPERKKVYPRSAGFTELQALADSGRNVGVIFHGSDIRRPDLHMRTHAWSPFVDPRNRALTEELTRRSQAIHEQLAKWSGPVMVSTPDLVDLAAGAVWTPVVVDLELFGATPPRPESEEPPVVVHMPSSSALKGTALIDPILRELADAGTIRYRRVQNLPHAQVPELLAGADIFVDQLGLGIFGVAPLEAMASGVAVVTDPGPEALTIYGEEVPIFPVDPDSMAATIRRLASDRALLRDTAARGRDFVQRHHDGRRSAASMRSALGLG
jgi:glycosyltransferase involved in cell wall biosynthesis